MLAFFSLLYKELILLLRDRVGLFLLFLMPVTLVFIITVLQVSNPKYPSKLPILFINQDGGDIAKIIEQKINENSNFSIVPVKSAEKATEQVASGRYKILVILPKNISKNIEEQSKNSLIAQEEPLKEEQKIQVYFDPNIIQSVSSYISSEIYLVIQQYQMQAMASVVGNILGTPTATISKDTIPISFQFAGHKGPTIKQNPVQQNVPAWALFGMFFLVIPMSSIIIHERDDGISVRMRMAPISKFSLISARISVFVFINVLQLYLMLMVGIFLLPLLGMPALSISGHFWIVTLIGICAGLAATSFGLLVGVFSSTIEQASAVGPILVVIASAVGGIMVPTYFMSPVLQSISHYSPLNWAHTALIDVLVRGGTLSTIYPYLLQLVAFTCIAVLIALLHRRSY